MAVKLKYVVKHNYPELKAYWFGKKTDGNASMKSILGGKGANLADMALMGVPVPPGFTLPCEASITYGTLKDKPSGMLAFMDSVTAQVKTGLAHIASELGYVPLLSVRSGARVSMPGMMDTILNVGITSGNLPHWIEVLGERTALDSYRRLIQMYSSVALGVPMSTFDVILATLKDEFKVASDTEITATGMRVVVTTYLETLKSMGVEFPDTLALQLRGAITAVFKSWDNPRAVDYRKLNNIPYEWGTAVTVQAMVFGNLNDKSATGVLFTRNPSTGADEVTGEFLVNAQGEDVVAGIRTPLKLAAMQKWNPNLLTDLVCIVADLEEHYKDMQDVEFTIQDGKLFILQTRTGKRSAMAAVKIAHDMAVDGIISKETAVARVTPPQLLAIMQGTIAEGFNTPPDFTGIAAGGGVVSGMAVFTSEDAINCKEPCILVRHETSPDDLMGINAAQGILTATGGLTSHAAVVARGMNKTCVVGASAIKLASDVGFWYGNGDHYITFGSHITIDGTTGNVWVTVDVPLTTGGLTKEAGELLSWAMEHQGGREQRVSMVPTMDPFIYLTPLVSDRLYIETATLFHTHLTSAEIEGMFAVLGAVLNDLPLKSVVIDLTDLESMTPSADEAHWFMLGTDPAILEKRIISRMKIQISALQEWPDALLEKTVVKLPENCPVDVVGLAGDLRLAKAISCVADLLAANAPPSVSQAVIDKVFGSQQAYNEIISLIEAAKGLTLSGSVADPVYWYSILEGNNDATV